jgi:hypothetical protein
MDDYSVLGLRKLYNIKKKEFADEKNAISENI